MSFVAKPCQHCPFRRDVTPFLHPARAEELAYSACNPFNNFPCHKTTEYNEEYDDMVETEASLTCAGWLTLQAAEGYDDAMPPGFEPSYDMVYDSAKDMIDAYEDEWGRD